MTYSFDKDYWCLQIGFSCPFLIQGYKLTNTGPVSKEDLTDFSTSPVKFSISVKTDSRYPLTYPLTTEEYWFLRSGPYVHHLDMRFTPGTTLILKGEASIKKKVELGYEYWPSLDKKGVPHRHTGYSNVLWWEFGKYPDIGQVTTGTPFLRGQKENL